MPAVILAALTLAGVAGFLRAQQAVTGNLWGVPVDDAYIHFQFARNLATGHGFAFNPDQAVPGSTSPLWVILLAAAYKVGIPLWLAAKVFGTLFLGIAALLVWRIALRLGLAVPVALAAGALTALDGRLLWAAPSGMEVTLFAALCLAAFLVRLDVTARSTPAGGSEREGPTDAAATRRGLLLVALLSGLATLTRPEGLLLFVVIMADVVWRCRPRTGSLAGAVILYLALVAPYAAFSLATSGHILPTTFYAKSRGIGPDTLSLAVQYVAVLAYYGLLTNPPALIVAPIGAFALWRMRGEARALVAWPVLLLVFQAVLSPLLYHFGRYAMPLQPFFALWAVTGLARLTRTPTKGQTWRGALPSLALVVVGVLTLGTWAGAYARSVYEINTMQVGIGKWVRDHVPAGAPIALNDIGAITYIGGHPAIDVVGLVSPAFISLQRETPASRAERDVFAALRRQGARYLIIFPAWYPQLAAQPGLHKVYSVTIRHPIVVGAPTMVVYKMPL